jgi:hypothetical protein
MDREHKEKESSREIETHDAAEHNVPAGSPLC